MHYESTILFKMRLGNIYYESIRLFKIHLPFSSTWCIFVHHKEVLMPSMLRKQIYIAPRQERLLKTKASELHISESELIRDGIDKALKTETASAHDPTAWDGEK